MWSNSLGKAFTVTCFGESHSLGVGATVDGCPAGLSLTIEDLQQALDLRIPQEAEVVSARREPDAVEIVSGVFENYTTGAPITLNISNRDAKSSDYEQLKDVVRPGLAYYPPKREYGAFSRDRRAATRSGPVTASLIVALALRSMPAY